MITMIYELNELKSCIKHAIFKNLYIIFSLTTSIVSVFNFIFTLNQFSLFIVFIMNFPFRAIIIGIILKIKSRKW